MHIEPGVVTGAKMILSYATATAAGATGLFYLGQALKERGLRSVALRSAVATVATFSFFELLPHVPVGVSEVHLILGSTLFLVLGAGPAAFGLTMGLLLQGLFFAPFDLPQFGINMTTLLVPLFGLVAIAQRIIAPGTAYVDLSYGQVLRLSLAYQGGVVAWVAFWSLYGEGLAAAEGIVTFGAAYLTVVLIEPLVDLAVLGAAKALRGRTPAGLVTSRLYSAA